MREDTTRARNITWISRIRAEGIDLDQPGTDTRNLAEPTITDNQRIRAGPQQKIHRHQSVGQTMRMIRNHDERPRTRDAREALIAPSVAQTRLLHRGGEEIRASRHMDTFKEGIEGPDLEEAVQNGLSPGQRAEIGLKFVGIVGSALR